MNNFIKTYRKNAGLTQEQLAEKIGVTTVSVQNWENGKTKIKYDHFLDLAEVFNVPVDMLIKEMLIEEDKKRPDRWPRFLFDDDTNGIIDTLHLNLAQQELFGLLYIYDSEYLKKKKIDFNTLNDDLKRVPYGFIEKVGSIHFMNQVDGLHNVIKHVKADFIMKVLRQNPDSEFNIKKLSKNLICEFIDDGYKPVNDFALSSDDQEHPYEANEGLYFHISMKKAKIILPVLDKRAIHLTDKEWANEPKKDIPDEALRAILSMCDFNEDLWTAGYYKSKYNTSYIRSGLELITDYHAVQSAGEEDKWILEINEKGRQLLNWLNEE